MNKKYSQFTTDCSLTVKHGISLSRFCAMKVGGPADLLVEAKTKAELVEVLRLAHKLNIKYFIIAGGSNVVFPDKGWRGLVVRYVADKLKVNYCHSRVGGDPDKKTNKSISVFVPVWIPDPGCAEVRRSGMTEKVEGERIVEVEAGAMLGKVVRDLIKQGWGGFNFLANIPGSVGGAIVGNAGCYGKEIKDYLKTIEIFNVKTGKISVVKPDKLELAYRHSKLKNHPELIVLSATFKLEKVDKKQALKEITAEKELRRDKHPLSPSCGSWFKNPSRTEPAWKFIEVAGLKGAIVGGAKVSNKHANFLINYHHAKAIEVLKLSKLVQQKVKAKTGIVLTEEVRIVNK